MSWWTAGALVCAGIAGAWLLYRAGRRTRAREIEAEAHDQARRMAEYAEQIRASTRAMPDDELDSWVFRSPGDRE